MVLDPIPQSLPVHFFGSRPQPPTSRSVNAFLAAALTRVMRAAVPIPAVASASVFHSAAVVGSVVGVVGPL